MKPASGQVISKFRSKTMFLILSFLTASVIGFALYFNRDWFSKSHYYPLSQKQKVDKKEVKTPEPQKEESLDSLDERFLYKFLRMENERVYIDDSLVLDIIKQTIKKIKDKDKKIMFAYENKGDVLRVLFAVKKDNEVVQKRYTFRVRKNICQTLSGGECPKN